GAVSFGSARRLCSGRWHGQHSCCCCISIQAASSIGTWIDKLPPKELGILVTSATSHCLVECGAVRRRATCRLPAGARQRNPERRPTPKTARLRPSRAVRG